jgi:NADH:ubiquinone oxidoreductase subunit 3 (subunit A)
MMYLTGFPLLFLCILFAAILPFIMLAVSGMVQFQMPSQLKFTSYESGMRTFGDSRIQFDVKFYLYALLFIIFDIETVFLYPWAVAFTRLAEEFGFFVMAEMGVFLGILGLGLVYAWKKDALRWQ